MGEQGIQLQSIPADKDGNLDKQSAGEIETAWKQFADECSLDGEQNLVGTPEGSGHVALCRRRVFRETSRRGRSARHPVIGHGCTAVSCPQHEAT